MLIDILIPTLESRRERFDALYNEFSRQITENKLHRYVNIQFMSDDGTMPVGEKRNCLLRSSRADYIWYFDDDDTPHRDMVQLIHQAVLNKPDVVTFDGEVNFRGNNPVPMLFKLKYKQFERTEEGFVRPPTHLCPMRRELVKDIFFTHDKKGSDVKWAMEVSDKGILKTECYINKILYTYNYDSTK